MYKYRVYTQGYLYIYCIYIYTWMHESQELQTNLQCLPWLNRSLYSYMLHPHISYCLGGDTTPNQMWGHFSLHLLVILGCNHVCTRIHPTCRSVCISIHLRWSWWPKKSKNTNEHHHKSPGLLPWNHQEIIMNSPLDPWKITRDPMAPTGPTRSWQWPTCHHHRLAAECWERSGSKKNGGWRSITDFGWNSRVFFGLMSNLIPIFLDLGFDVKTRLSGWAISCGCIFQKNDYTS